MEGGVQLTTRDLSSSPLSSLQQIRPSRSGSVDCFFFFCFLPESMAAMDPTAHFSSAGVASISLEDDGSRVLTGQMGAWLLTSRGERGREVAMTGKGGGWGVGVREEMREQRVHCVLLLLRGV